MSTVGTYPITESPRTMAFAGQAQTEPIPGGFMRSVMCRRDVDDFDGQQEKKFTQEEQDAEDEEMRKQAMKNLVNSWQERLQLISVITTFFATTEAAMLVNTRPGSSDDQANIVLTVSNASLLGSLILHVYASVLSFLGAFLLISYKLREAKREELIAEGVAVTSPVGESIIKDVEQGLRRTHTSKDTQLMRSMSTSAPERNKMNGSYLAEPPVVSAYPHIEQVGLLESTLSSHRLLSRTHAVCVFLAAVGFILAIIGIVCYAWALLPAAVGIFTSACLGAAMLSMFALRI